MDDRNSGLCQCGCGWAGNDALRRRREQVAVTAARSALVRVEPTTRRPTRLARLVGSR